MYAILISAALAIYTVILVDFSVLYQEISINNDILTSTQALYTAEGAIENTVGLIGENDLTVSNIKFLDEADNSNISESSDFLQYNEGIDSFYIKRKLTLDSPNLNSAEASNENNRLAYSGVYLSNGQALDKKAYYGLEPRKSKGFVIREVDTASNFNEINFEFNQGEENSALLFEIFVLPKEGELINFQDFQSLRSNPEGNPIERISINTLDESKMGLPFGNNFPLTVDLRNSDTSYKKRLTISGFQPLQKNYIIYFQTLDNKPTHFKLIANYQGKTVVLPNMMQTVDIIGATPTGLYSRVKYQRQSEEGIAPGLNFVHFTNQSLIK